MGIGVKDNVKLCADGAFSMEDSPYWNEEVNRVAVKILFTMTMLWDFPLVQLWRRNVQKWELPTRIPWFLLLTG